MATGRTSRGHRLQCPQSGTLSQQLATTLAANTKYQLSVDVGDRLDRGFPNYSISLYAAGNLLHSVGNAQFTAIDEGFVTASPTYISPPTVAAGQALRSGSSYILLWMGLICPCAKRRM